MVFIDKGQIDVIDGALVVVDAVNGVRTQIPVGSVTCIMLEPGTRISHAAVALAATVGCLLVWIGDAGVRLYAAGQPGGARSDRLLYQAKLALDDAARLKVIRKMYEVRFGEDAPQRRSIEQLRGIEGARVRRTYEILAQKAGITWSGRNYDRAKWDKADVTNRCLSAATHALYGVTEAAVLAAGYAPAIGFLHTGKPRSFVYDIADLVKFETVVPIAFRVAASGAADAEREVRLGCRNAFRKTRLLSTLIPLIEEVLAAGELSAPASHEEAMPVPFLDPENIGDAGHRT